MRVSETIGCEVQNLTNDVPNFVNDVPRIPKCVPRWRSTTNNFLMGSQMKLWTLGDKMGVPEVIGWDVPNFTKDVPNFTKDVPNFVKDVPRIPKCVPMWELTPNHFLMGSKMKLSTISVRWGSQKQLDQMYQILSRMYLGFQSVF